MVLGLAGTLLPVLPGLLLMWVAAVVYGLVIGLDPTAWTALILITGILLAAWWIGLRIPQQRTSSAGVSTGNQLVALLLAGVGFFAIPVAGAIIGFVGGIFIMSWLATRDRTAAWGSTKAALSAMWRAAAVQFGAGVAILIVWSVWITVG